MFGELEELLHLVLVSLNPVFDYTLVCSWQFVLIEI